MLVRGILLYALYFAIVGTATTVMFRAIGIATVAAEPKKPSDARAALSCEDTVDTLHQELWAWYVQDIRQLGPDAVKRGPLPGPLNEWEGVRQAAEERCRSNKTREQFQHLLSLRRALESQAYLLSTTAGADIAALR